MFLKTIDNDFTQAMIRTFGGSRAAVTPLPFHLIGTDLSKSVKFHL